MGEKCCKFDACELYFLNPNDGKFYKDEGVVYVIDEILYVDESDEVNNG